MNTPMHHAASTAAATAAFGGARSSRTAASACDHEALPPLPYAHLLDLARLRAQRRPDGRAFTFLRGGERESAHLTFAELDHQARCIAARLQRQFEPGDRVLLAYAPGLEFIVAFFGCIYAGVIAVPACPPTGTAEVARLGALAADAGAVGLCLGATGFNSGHLRRAAPALLRSLRCITTSDGTELLSADAWVEPSVTAADIAFLQYTSGSTGMPKGVAVSHANVLHNQRLIERGLGLSARSRALSWLPPVHDMGLIGHVVQPLHLGITSVLMAPAAFLARPACWLQAITDHRTTVSGGPNFAYELCIRRVAGDQMRTLDLSAWNVAFNGAEIVRAQTLERFAKKFASRGFRAEAFRACYGLAEATLYVSSSARGKPPAARRVDADQLQQHRVVAAGPQTRNVRSIVACGRALAARLAIVDPQTRTECASDHVGEIWIRGGSVAPAYWNDPAATRSSFGAFLADSDEGPFLRTGDLGFIDNGELHVTGRLRDLIAIDGRNFCPSDLEDAVRASYPALEHSSAAAFATAVHEACRLVVMVEVARSERRRLPHARIEAAARAAIAAEFGVSLHELVLIADGTLPRTPGGKIRRQAACAAYLERACAAAPMQQASVPHPFIPV